MKQPYYSRILGEQQAWFNCWLGLFKKIPYFQTEVLTFIMGGWLTKPFRG